MRHGARHSGVQCAGRTMKLELAPPCAAREFIPLRTNALIEIGKPGTCFEDRCECLLQRHSSDPAADTSREPLFETRTTHCCTYSEPVTTSRQVARSALVVRGHCQSILGHRRRADDLTSITCSRRLRNPLSRSRALPEPHVRASGEMA